jgi:hypothetical protein
MSAIRKFLVDVIGLDKPKEPDLKSRRRRIPGPGDEQKLAGRIRGDHARKAALHLQSRRTSQLRDHLSIKMNIPDAIANPPRTTWLP